MGSTILMIEDGDVEREALAGWLRREGYAVLTAADGREALDRLRRGPRPDLVLLDMLLPGADGWEFLRRRRQDSALARVPVLMMTAVGVASREWASSLGAAGYLKKPFETEDLLREVRRCLG
jgi:CheY-like chemotaxis protein